MKKNKRKNQKGFTLIELLAVVVILLAISVMAISSISAAIERSKDKQNETKKSVIVSYGELYYDEHRNSMSTSGCIKIDLLGLSEDESTDANGEKFTGGVRYTNGADFKYDENCS